MPFRVELTDEAKHEFETLHELARRGESLDVLYVIQSAFGKRHDLWPDGLRFRDQEISERDIRMLENGPVVLIYELFETEQRVKILNIIRIRAD